MNNKLLISSSAKKTIRESAQLANELNTGLEISRLPFYKNINTSENDVILQLKEDLKDFKNRITVHALFSDLNIATQDLLLRKTVELRYTQSLNTAKQLKADTVLFHTGNKGTLHYGSQESFKRNFICFWKDFIKEFEHSNITAVIENVFETSPYYCLDLTEKVNSNNFKLALDSGHVNLYAHNTKVVDWIKAYNKNLYHMHIHNNFRTNDDHSNLENGTLDYNEIFSAIKELNLSPSIVLEMFSEEDIRKSIDFINRFNQK